MATAAQWFLVVIFAWAGGSKLLDRPGFLRKLVSLPWLSVARARTLAWMVPVSELGLAAGLLVAPRWFGGVAAAMLLLFSAIVARELLAGRDFTCGCFGADTQSATWVPLLRNSVLLAVAAVAIMGQVEVAVQAVMVGIGCALAFLLVDAGIDTMRLARR